MMDLGPGASMVLIAFAVSLAVAFRGSRRSRLQSGAEAGDAVLRGWVEYLESRLAEVEERLDFAERLLARGRAAGGLPEGSER